MLLAALRWRRAGSIATALLAALTVLGIVVGPLWTRAGSESLLRDSLTSAPRAVNAALGEAHGVPGKASTRALDAAFATVVLPYHRPAVHGLNLLGTITHGATTLGAPLVWRDDLCAHIVLVSGRCPQRAGEVLLHRGTASRLAVTAPVALDALVTSGRSTRPDLDTRYAVVGTYLQRDPESDYWVGEQASFVAYESVADGRPDRTQAVLTVPPTFDAIAVAHTGRARPLGFATATRLLEVNRVRLRDVPTLRTTVEKGQVALANASTGAVGLELRDGVTDALDAAANDAAALRRSTTVVLSQLVLLALGVLVLVVAGSAVARGPEVATVRLRGLPRRMVLGLAVGEPLALVAVALPLGALAAWVGVRVLAGRVLLAGTPVALTGPTLLTLLLAALVLLVAVLTTCARVLARPVLSLWERTAPEPSRGAAVRDGLLVAVAAGAAYGCARGGPSAVLLTAVPVSLAVAVVGVRLLPLLMAPAQRRSRGRRGVVGFLAVRQLARRRDGAVLAGLLVVAVGLAVSSTTGWSVARGATAVRADLEVGARRVLLVQPDAQHPDVDLTEAVKAVDPGGTKAMAVLEYLPFSNDPGGRLLAVDRTRFAAVARWDAEVLGVSVESVVRDLGQPGSAVVTEKVRADTSNAFAKGVPPGGTLITGTDGAPHPVKVSGVVRSLPRALTNATLVDASVFAAVPRTQVAALWEVWTTTTDPGLVQALKAQGLQVVRIEEPSQRRAVLGRQGPGLALALALAASGLALLLGAATVLFSALTAARRRGFELAALAALGVPRGQLARSARLETLLLLASGLSFGAVAGAVSGLLVVPHLTLFSDDAAGFELPRQVSAAPLLVLAGFGIVVALVTSLLVARVLVRAADPQRLREVQA